MHRNAYIVADQDIYRWYVARFSKSGLNFVQFNNIVDCARAASTAGEGVWVVIIHQHDNNLVHATAELLKVANFSGKILIQQAPEGLSSPRNDRVTVSKEFLMGERLKAWMGVMPVADVVGRD